MKLKINDVMRIATGVTGSFVKDGYICFNRFSEAQINAYKASGNNDFYNKTFATAGVRLAFSSDTKYFAFDYRISPASSRNFAYFDVYQNKAFIKHIDLNPCEGITYGHFEVQPTGSDIEIHFPWTKSIQIKNVTVDDGAIVTPTHQKPLMICYGDSITQGYDVVCPSLCYVSRTARRLNCTYINRGIGGDCFFPQLLEHIDEVEPQIVTVAYGTNDWYKKTRDEFLKNATAFIAGMDRIYPNAIKFVITPIWRADYQKTTIFGEPFNTVKELLSDICGKYNDIYLLDGEMLYPHLPDFFSDKYLHPNDIGFGIYSENLYREMKKNESVYKLLEKWKNT